MASKAITVTDFRTHIPGQLSEDRKEWTFPTIHSVTSLGKRSTWTLRVRVVRGDPLEERFVKIADKFFTQPMGEEYSGWIKVDSALEGGKTRDSVPTIVSKGKNIGRSNETNVFQQALRDALGMYTKKLKHADTGAASGKKTSEGTTSARRGEGKASPSPRKRGGGGDGARNSPGDAGAPILPMLATSLASLKKEPPVSEEYPAYVQPKFNGVRAVAAWRDGAVDLTSRSGGQYPGAQHIRDELTPLLRRHPTIHLDGELYKHGESLQLISGAARGGTGDDLRFMVFDCFDASKPEMKYSERMNLLDTLFDEMDDMQHVEIVPSVRITSLQPVQAMSAEFVRQGLEGAMVRLDEPYRQSTNNHHSNVLLKVKPVYDHEFELVDFFTAEKGKARGALMLVCRTGPWDAHAGSTAKEEKTFNVTPALELPHRIELAREFALIGSNGRTYFENEWKGVKIIVLFDEWSRDGIPLRARTRMEVRTWE